ncbi:cell wall metabolism sensor histidine kinase WalK [uncultured Gemmiger sp.]|uniref:sensor histidine kinase n=1 Tax=uncultured Gemmiger sp. TaxID=1623490 RepID=UPI00265DF4FF|nr:HAMP domain-containing sensor histidine kinase [uncultured Gemmiger sp.]
MRYYQKLVSLLVLVLAASFGVGGCVLLYSDFAVQRGRMATANAAAHAQTCTLLQTEILDLQRRGTTMDDAALTARVEARDTPAALWRGDTLICATLPGLENFSLENAATVTVRTEERVYAVYASDLQGGLRLVTAYDLTGLYRDRDAALTRFLLLEAAVLAAAAAVTALLAAAAAVTALLAARLTRPLAVLTDAGQQIAAGDYARRTALHTGDEIETLSASFDKMADAVQEKIADLEADVQKREDFVGAFTHELKTPMTSIIGYADILAAMQTDPDEQREAAAAIAHEGRRLESLSHKLLALLGLAECPLTPAAVPLAVLWPRLHAACPGVNLHTPAAPAPTVQGDADLLLDLLCNLVQNAAKASKPGAPVVVLCTADADTATLTVADRGCGIPPDQLARVTEPFYMVDKSRARRQGGSGLGLALCQRIAAAHDGTLKIESEPGKGTRVSVTLPLWKKEADA